VISGKNNYITIGRQREKRSYWNSSNWLLAKKTNLCCLSL